MNVRSFVGPLPKLSLLQRIMMVMVMRVVVVAMVVVLEAAKWLFFFDFQPPLEARKGASFIGG